MFSTLLVPTICTKLKLVFECTSHQIVVLLQPFKPNSKFTPFLFLSHKKHYIWCCFTKNPKNGFKFGVWLEKSCTPKLIFGVWLEMVVIVYVVGYTRIGCRHSILFLSGILFCGCLAFPTLFCCLFPNQLYGAIVVFLIPAQILDKCVLKKLPNSTKTGYHLWYFYTLCTVEIVVEMGIQEHGRFD